MLTSYKDLELISNIKTAATTTSFMHRFEKNNSKTYLQDWAILFIFYYLFI